MMKQRKRDNGNFHNNKYTVEWKEGNDIEAKWSDAPNGFIHCAVIVKKSKVFHGAKYHHPIFSHPLKL